MAPTASPTIYSSPKFTQLSNLVGEKVTLDIKALQNRTTLQYAAMDWLANEDAWEVDIDSVPSQVFVERYVVALLFLSTHGTSWRNNYNFLTPTSVCEWNITGETGVACNEDELVVGLHLGKSKHEELDFFNLVHMNAPLVHISFPSYLYRWKSTRGFHYERTRSTDVVDLARFPYVDCFVLFL
jgi:hypothetical protein